MSRRFALVALTAMLAGCGAGEVRENGKLAVTPGNLLKAADAFVAGARGEIRTCRTVEQITAEGRVTTTTCR